MARLVATIGTSPGVVYETLLNLCRGTYDAPSPAPLSIDEVVLLHTSSSLVKSSARVAQLLIHCGNSFLSRGKILPGNCKVKRVLSASIEAEDIDSHEAFQEFYETARSFIGEGDVVDISGGRAAMAAAAALAASRSPRALLATTIVPPQVYRAASAAFEKLRQYDLDILVNIAVKEGCNMVAKRIGEAVRILNDLVVGDPSRAKTIVFTV